MFLVKVSSHYLNTAVVSIMRASFFTIQIKKEGFQIYILGLCVGCFKNEIVGYEIFRDTYL